MNEWMKPYTLIGLFACISIQVLKMQLEACQQTIYKTQQQGQYTYGVFANSTQIR